MTWLGSPELWGVLTTAISAFLASNLDDILLLLLLFSAAQSRQGAWTVVAGQYLGFSLLVGASLIGFAGGQLLPPAWIGSLGLLPVSLGVTQLIDSLGASEETSIAPVDVSIPPWLQRRGQPFGELAAIAAITVANGGDNVGLYVPLFARCSAPQLGLTLLVFALLVAVWCATAWGLLQTPAIASLVQSHARPVVPFVLIGLGLLILIDSPTLANRCLAVLVICGLGAMALSLARQLRQIALRQPQTAITPASLPSR